MNIWKWWVSDKERDKIQYGKYFLVFYIYYLSTKEKRNRKQNIQSFLRLTKTSQFKRASKFSSCKNSGPSLSPLSLSSLTKQRRYSLSFYGLWFASHSFKQNHIACTSLTSLIHIIITYPFFLSPFSLFTPTQNNYCYCFCFYSGCSSSSNSNNSSSTLTSTTSTRTPLALFFSIWVSLNLCSFPSPATLCLSHTTTHPTHRITRHEVVGFDHSKQGFFFQWWDLYML